MGDVPRRARPEVSGKARVRGRSAAQAKGLPRQIQNPPQESLYMSPLVVALARAWRHRPWSVCETTGHAETVLVYFDPKLISYAELLNVFFTSQDPTTPDRQGPDRGDSYRSIIFYNTEQEKEFAEKAKVFYSKSFKNPIVSEIVPLKAFYKAEEYHQNYIEHNPYSQYVMGVSIPRYDLFKRTYKGKLKSHKKE